MVWYCEGQDPSTCPSCNADLAWWNTVTGPAEPDGYTEEVELEELTPAVYETCNLGHLHETAEPTYKIPQNRGRLIK